MRTVFGQMTNPFDITISEMVIVVKSDPVIGITNVIESGDTVTITFHIPALDPENNNIPVELFAVFCNNAAESFAGAPAVLANGTYPKVEAALPSDFTAAQDVTATIPVSMLTRGHNYKVFSIVNYD